MSNDLSSFDAQAWSKTLIKNIDEINIMMPLCNTDYEGEIQGVGDTVQVRTLGSITLGAWTRNGTISYQDLTPAKEAMTISDAEYFAFKVDDVDKAQNDISALEGYTKRAAVALSNTIEHKILAFAQAAVGTAMSIDAGGGTAITLDSGTSTATGIYQQVVKARTRLSKNEVPPDGRWLIVDPDTTALMLEDTSHFVRAGDLGDEVVEQATFGAPGPALGYIGRIAGFDVFECAHCYSSGGTTYLPFGRGNCLSYAAQIREVEAIRLETTFATSVRGLLLHGGTVFTEDKKRVGYIVHA